MPNVVIFSDLDGTLLDHETYSFQPADEALNLIKLKNVPLVLSTSKTRKEIELYRNLLDNHCPFVSENGGGIFIPKEYFSKDFTYDQETKEYKVIEIGTTRNDLTSALKSISKDTGIKIQTLSDMSAIEIAEITGLDLQIAQLAMQRDYSEPFMLEDEKYAATIEKEITLKGYKHTKGGRFHHILGNNDKGKAINILKKIYKSESGDLVTVGIGDSLNDLAMLNTVDIPILVQKPNGTYDPDINLPKLSYAEGIGPTGWNSSILKLFIKFDQETLNTDSI